MNLQVAVLVGMTSFCGALLGVGIAWGSMKTKVDAVMRWVSEHEEKLDDHAERITKVEAKLTFLR